MEKEELERKIEDALKQPDTVVEGLFNVKEGLEVLGKDERTTKQMQTMVARRLEECANKSGNGNWLVRNQQRIYVDRVGKSLIRFAVDLMQKNTLSEFENQFLKVTSEFVKGNPNFVWREHIHFCTYTANQDFVMKHWNLSIEDIGWYYGRLFDLDREIGRSIGIYEDGELDTDNLLFGYDTKLWEWLSYITISRGKWMGMYFQRNEVEILPIKIDEFEKMFPDELTEEEQRKIRDLSEEEIEALKRELLKIP